MSYLRLCLTLLVYVILFTSATHAQSISLTDLPPDTYNNRFEYEDALKNKIFRPVLSVRGFDSDRFGDNGSYGLGLKQVLERVYNQNNSNAELAFIELIDEAGQSLNLSNFDGSRSQVEHNARVLQARAFVALVTYVLEQNGIDIASLNANNPDITLPNHAQALSDFREAWDTQSVSFPFIIMSRTADDRNADVMKWSRSIMTFARAVDFYLALENAYDHYGGSGRQEYNSKQSTTLLDESDRAQLINQYQGQIDRMRTWSRAGIADYADPVPSLLIPWLSFLASELANTENVDEVQYGNWPLITKLATAYASP